MCLHVAHITVLWAVWTDWYPLFLPQNLESRWAVHSKDGILASPTVDGYGVIYIGGNVAGLDMNSSANVTCAGVLTA